MAAKRETRTEEINEEAIFKHNLLADYLSVHMVEDDFQSLIDLFKDCPLTPKDLINITTVQELFLKLKKNENISIGHYEYFTERLEKVDKSLASYVRREEQEIRDVLNAGISPGKQVQESIQQSNSDSNYNINPVGAERVSQLMESFISVAVAGETKSSASSENTGAIANPEIFCGAVANPTTGNCNQLTVIYNDLREYKDEFNIETMKVKHAENLSIGEQTVLQPVDVEVTFEYAAEQDDELNIKVGDIIKNVTMSEGGWWEGELNSKVGMFPDNFVKVIEKPKPTKVKEDQPAAPKKDINKHRGASVRELASKIKDDVHVGMGAPKKKETHQNTKRKKAKVVFSYEPENADELKLEVGNIVEVLKQEEEGWWEGSLDGKVGVFPSNFVEEIEESEPEKTPEEKPSEAPVEGKKKVIGGVGLGNIFEGGPIKLKSTNLKNTDKASHSPPDPVVRHIEEEKSHAVTKREKPVERAVVRYSYTADNDDELTLKEGEIITILDRELEDAGWWKGEVNGRVGVFPDNFVEDLPAEEPRPKKPPPPGSTKQAPKLPEKAPVSDAVKHEKHDKHDKPLPPEPTSIEKIKKETDKHHPPSISSKKPSVPPPVGRKPMQPKPAEPKPSVSVPKEEPKPVHIKEEKKETSGDSFDNLQTSDRLTHLTASRAKGPSKRPPSQVMFHNVSPRSLTIAQPHIWTSCVKVCE